MPASSSPAPSPSVRNMSWQLQVGVHSCPRTRPRPHLTSQPVLLAAGGGKGPFAAAQMQTAENSRNAANAPLAQYGRRDEKRRRAHSERRDGYRNAGNTEIGRVSQAGSAPNSSAQASTTDEGVEVREGGGRRSSGACQSVSGASGPVGPPEQAGLAVRSYSRARSTAEGKLRQAALRKKQRQTHSCVLTCCKRAALAEGNWDPS